MAFSKTKVTENVWDWNFFDIKVIWQQIAHLEKVKSEHLDLFKKSSFPHPEVCLDWEYNLRCIICKCTCNSLDKDYFVEAMNWVVKCLIILYLFCLVIIACTTCVGLYFNNDSMQSLQIRWKTNACF